MDEGDVDIITIVIIFKYFTLKEKYKENVGIRGKNK